jgi:hypothetical protein
MSHISDDYETDGQWDEFLFLEDDDFDETDGPIAAGTAVRSTSMPGVICRIDKYRRDGWVVLHIIGDDHPWPVEPDTLTVVDDNICSCGQDGCGWAGV